MREGPLEVAHVIESLGQGGAEQNLLSLLRALPRERFRHHLAWLYPDDRLLEAFRPHVASLRPLAIRGRLGLLGAAVRLAGWLRTLRPDLVHTQLIRAQLVGRAAAALAGVPVVTTWQNVFYDERALAEFGHSRPLRAVTRALDGLSGRRDRHFIAVSAHVAAEQARHLGVTPERVSVIFNAVEPERYAPLPPEARGRLRAALELPAQARVLLAVGRLVEQKGHRVLLDCLPAVRAVHPEAVLLIAGQGPLRTPLAEAIAARGLGGQVRLLGARPDVPALLQAADLFVFPSHYEGLSVALVEALAAGLPAVVSDLPQNHEVADGLPGVRFVPLGNPGPWADAITAALTEAPRPHAALADARAGLRRSFAPDTLAAQTALTFFAAAGRPAPEAVAR